jgi:hypothetical protein
MIGLLYNFSSYQNVYVHSCKIHRRKSVDEFHRFIICDKLASD